MENHVVFTIRLNGQVTSIVHLIFLVVVIKFEMPINAFDLMIFIYQLLTKPLKKKHMKSWQIPNLFAYLCVKRRQFLY